MAEHTTARLVSLEQAQQEMYRNLRDLQGHMNRLTETMTRLVRNLGQGVTNQQQNQEALGSPTLTQMQVPAHDPALAHQGILKQVRFISPTMEHEAEVPKFPAPKEDMESPAIARLEERLKAIEKTETYGLFSPDDLCLVSGIVFSPQVKMPNFEKFSGTQCPKFHLKMYYGKMEAYVHNDRLLIHCFQESLTGGPLQWYLQCQKSHINTWQDLATAFLNKYKHITELAPDRLTLQELEQKSTESFKDYARRWREVAMEVQPPLNEKELTTIFLNTLRGVYYEKMVGNATSNFSDLVASGEKIELGIKTGRIMEVPTHQDQVQSAWQNESSTLKRKRPRRKASKATPFEPPSLDYGKLFPKLLEAGLLTPESISAPQPPYLKWYDPAKSCEFHASAIGHSTEDCNASYLKLAFWMIP